MVSYPRQRHYDVIGDCFISLMSNFGHKNCTSEIILVADRMGEWENGNSLDFLESRINNN